MIKAQRCQSNVPGVITSSSRLQADGNQAVPGVQFPWQLLPLVEMGTTHLERSMRYDSPRFALIEINEGFLVEPFDSEKHLTNEGWSYPGIQLFVDQEEVAHLRDQILN